MVAKVLRRLVMVFFFCQLVFSFVLRDKTVYEGILPSYLVMLISVVLIVLMVQYARKKQLVTILEERACSSRNNMLFAFVILFGLQFFLCLNISFRTSWDPQAVMYCAKYAAEKDLEGMKNMSSYLSIYPSNSFLVWLFSVIYYWNGRLHITNDVLNLLQIVQCMISTLTAFLTYKCVQKITNSKFWARVSFFLYVLITGITGWLVIPYSDSIGLFLPILTLFLIIRYREIDDGIHKCLITTALGYLAYMSYRLKPIIDIVAIAFVIISLLEVAEKIKNGTFRKKSLGFVLAFALGFLISVFAVNSAVDSMGYELDPEMEFGWQHFIMQGVNEKSNGGNSDEDLAFSQNITNKAERDRINLDVARQRLIEMGPWGYAKLLCVKMYRPFSSGTFGWEGVGYHEKYEPRFGKVSLLLRSFFWEKKEVSTDYSFYSAYALIKQIAWCMCVAFVIFIGARRGKESFIEMVLYLTMIGLFLYFGLLESHPRFMLVVSPMVIITSVLGMKTIMNTRYE